MFALLGFLFIEHLSVIGAGAVQLRIEAANIPSTDSHACIPAISSRSPADACGLTGALRPLPTPCRAPMASAITSACFSTSLDTGIVLHAGSLDCDVDVFPTLGGMSTLLDIASREVDCPAFFMACTLVETLHEHFAEIPLPSAPATSIVTRRVLSLDVLLPDAGSPAAEMECVPEVFDLTARQCVIPCTARLMHSLERVFPFSMLQGPRGMLPRPDRFAHWLAQGHVGRSPAPDEIIVLTTDGSFDPHSGSAGWAVAVSLVSNMDLRLPGQFVGCISGSTSELQSVVGSAFPSNSAYLAEVAGLFWAALLAFRMPGSAPFVFRADNVGALHGVAGQASLTDHPLCRAAAAVHTAFRIRRGHPSYQHVLGHAADPANELADALAGRASAQQQGFSLPGLDLSEWLGDQGRTLEWLPHVCLAVSVPSTLPTQHEEVLSWSRATAPCTLSPSDVMRPFLRAVEGTRPSPSSGAAPCFLGCLASFNALSLLERMPNSHAAGLHGETGRVKLLCSAFSEHGVSLAGLQECRTPKSSMYCQGYHRFASGRDDNACYGCELWVSDKGVFDPKSVTVLHAEPTCLLASLSFLGRPLRVLVAHGPHRVHSEAYRASWWTRVHGICAAHRRDAACIVLADANCRIGSCTSLGIGPHQADPEDLTGGLFRELLADLGCWLPSTFEATSTGPGGTLYQRRSGDWDRSDFVAVPIDWRFSHCLAWVEPRISAGLDHMAVLVSCAIFSPVKMRSHAKAKRIDVDAVLHPDNRPAIDAVLSSVPCIPWDVDASEHAALLVDHMYRGLADLFPLPRKALRGAHFSELTQRLHRSVADLRHSLRARDGAYRATLLRCAWAAWPAAGPSFHTLFSGRWLWRLQICRALDCMLLRRFGRALRSSCRQDRRTQVVLLSDQVAEAPCAELHKAVRRIMRPKKFRQASNAPLPLLQRSDGTVCQSQEEVTEVWREHFRVLEAGKEIDAGALAVACRQRQADFEGTDLVDTSLVPTWAQLQEAFRATSPHKACGPDLLPPGICRLYSQRLTEAFWPVMLKAVLRSNEAVGLKGGILHRIAKPSAVANTTAGYRGILVQSCLSKVLHRAARHMAVSHWEANRLPLQIGGRKGCPASFGHFCSRAFLAMAKAQGRSAAILFVDIAAAYYGVVREAILGSCASGRPLHDLVECLGLSESDLQHLAFLVEQEPVLRQQGAAELFTEVANELHRNTWFVLAGDTQVVETHRGTRPGGSLADVVFSILFSKVLERRSTSVLQPCVPRVPWNGQRSPWDSTPGACSSCTVEASDVVYADDLASFLVSSCAEALPKAISSIAADTVDTLLPHGLNANIGPTKTAAVAVPAGKGSRAVRRRLYSENQGRLVVLPDSKSGFRLDLVAVYKHLGSLVTHDGNLLPEIRHRLAAGRSAMKEGKQRLFACRAIPLSKRAAIFRTHVLAAITPGMGTWPLLNHQEWQSFSGGMISLYRQLLCLRVEGGFHCSEAQIVSRVGLPRPSQPSPPGAPPFSGPDGATWARCGLGPAVSLWGFQRCSPSGGHLVA